MAGWPPGALIPAASAIGMAAHAVCDLGYIGNFMPGGCLGCIMTGQAGIGAQTGGMAALARIGPAVVEREGVRLVECRRRVGGSVMAGSAVGAE